MKNAGRFSSRKLLCSILQNPVESFLRTVGSGRVGMDLRQRLIEMRLEGIEESPRRLYFVEAQKPLLLSMDGFKEQETMFRETIADANERIF